jgi:hypothetical protein
MDIIILYYPVVELGILLLIVIYIIDRNDENFLLFKILPCKGNILFVINKSSRSYIALSGRWVLNNSRFPPRCGGLGYFAPLGR